MHNATLAGPQPNMNSIAHNATSTRMWPRIGRRLKPEKPGFNLETNNEAAPSW